MTIRRLAFAILRRYPPAWRERYEAEVSALIDQSGVRAADLAELVRGLLTERAAAMLLDDERPKRAMVFLGMLKLTCTVAIVAGGSILGYALRRLTGPWPEQAHTVATGLLLIFMVVFFVVAIRAHLPWSPLGPRYTAPVSMTLLLAFVACLVLVNWGQLFGPRPEAVSTMWLWNFLLTADLASGLWPPQRMLHVLGLVSIAESNIRTNQRWVDGCHTMIAQGVPSPLGEAQAQVAHWTRERDAARDQLHALGYRARFRN